MTGSIHEAAVIDFETLPIHDRPSYPPEPVGVAILIGNRKPRYYAFNHISGNNCTWGEARQALGELYDSGRPLLFHNAKFDLEVAATHMDLLWPAWHCCHDTLPMLFLDDPRADDYALKTSAERVLKQKPDERDAVVDWLVKQQPVPKVRLTDKPKGKNYAGAYVALAPAKLAGEYAIGDIVRTRDIARSIYSSLERRGLIGAYDLERELVPYLAVMEKQGMRVALKRLGRDIELYEATLERLERWLLKRLRIKNINEFNLNSGDQLAKALIACGAASRDGLGVTSTGKIQTNKDALEHGVTDKQVLAALKYRAKLCTCLRTFMRPWYATAQRSNGLIFTRWNSTRTDHAGGGVGTRTGRLSSTPNFQNLAKLFEDLFWSPKQRDLPRMPVKLPPLPLVRSYVVPYEKNDVLIDRDYSQQELRILGHFEDGALKQAYLNDPWLDVHALAQKLINDMLHADFARKPIKNTGFGLIYGMGLGLLAERSNTTVEMAKQVRDAYLAIFPGLKAMYAEMKRRAKADEPIYTWAGREYYCEEPVWVGHYFKQFDYKMLNVLIQGSAADCTKRATLTYLKTKPANHRLYLTAHDELLASVPKRDAHRGMSHMQACMEAVEFDIPMLTEGAWSDRNWALLKTYDKKGRRCAN